MDNDNFLIIGLDDKENMKILLWDMKKNEKFCDFIENHEFISVYP